MSSSSMAPSGPVTIAGLATGIPAVKALPADAATAAHVHDKALGVLRGFEKYGYVAKYGIGCGATWVLADH
jgi:hypothetical protein